MRSFAGEASLLSTVMVVPDVRHKVNIGRRRKIETGAQEAFFVVGLIAGAQTVKRCVLAIGIVVVFGIWIIDVVAGPKTQPGTNEIYVSIEADCMGGAIQGVFDPTRFAGAYFGLAQLISESFYTKRELLVDPGDDQFAHGAVGVTVRTGSPGLAVVILVIVKNQLAVQNGQECISIPPFVGLHIQRLGFVAGAISNQEVIAPYRRLVRGIKAALQTRAEVIGRSPADICNGTLDRPAIGEDILGNIREGRGRLHTYDKIIAFEQEIAPANVGQFDIRYEFVVCQQITRALRRRGEIIFRGEQQLGHEFLGDIVVIAQVDAAELELVDVFFDTGVLVISTTIQGIGVCLVKIIAENIAPDTAGIGYTCLESRVGIQEAVTLAGIR